MESPGLPQPRKSISNPQFLTCDPPAGDHTFQALSFLTTWLLPPAGLQPTNAAPLLHQLHRQHPATRKFCLSRRKSPGILFTPSSLFWVRLHAKVPLS